MQKIAIGHIMMIHGRAHFIYIKKFATICEINRLVWRVYVVRAEST